MTIPLIIGQAARVSVGSDAGAPVTRRYQPPYEFTGTIDRVIIDLSGEHIVDHEAKFRAIMARQ